MIKTTETFFESLDEELKARHLTLYSLVRGGYITDGEYNYIGKHVKEDDNYSPKFDLVIRLCKGLEVTPNDLLKDYVDNSIDALPPYVKRLLEVCKDMSQQDIEEVVRFIEEYKYAKEGKFWNASVFNPMVDYSENYDTSFLEEE